MRDAHRGGIIALWALSLTGAVLFALQTALAGSGRVTLRWLLTFSITAIAALLGHLARRGEGERASPSRAPGPAALATAGLAGLAIFPVAWWLMDLTDYALRAAGPLPAPDSLLMLNDTLFGLDLRPASYELVVLLGVALVPLAQAGLAWGWVQPALATHFGRQRAAWLAGALGGALMALSAVSDLVPGMPGGPAALGGYVLVGWVAAWAAYLAGSAWAGFAAHATFVYASFALRDDLARVLAGRGYLDVGWLTLLLLGGFAAVMLLQVVRFRTPRPPDPPRRGGAARLLPPLAVLLLALAVMTALDVAARRDEARAGPVVNSAAATDVAAGPPAAP